jgi:hypothetical protein
MKKGLLTIFLVSLVSLALVLPSCTGGTTGTIEVKATLDGSPWTGAVSYTLTPGSGSPTNGSSVDHSFTLNADTYTCAYVSGGPAGASFVSITPSATQALAAGGTTTFTLNFQSPVPVDASVSFDTWSINGTPVPPGIYYVPHGTIIDAHYKEHVAGNNTGAPVKVHQTAKLIIHNTGNEDSGNGEPMGLHVLNGPGAVMTDPPSDVSNQQATWEGTPVDICTQIPLPVCVNVTVDVEVDLDQVVCTTYTKKINWIGYPSPTDILFDMFNVVPFQTVRLVTSACIEVGAGFVDTNPLNDCSVDSPMIIIGFLP